MQAQRMDFLKEKFAEVPDLPEHVPGAVAPAPKPKASKPKKRPRCDFVCISLRVFVGLCYKAGQLKQLLTHRLDEPETQAPAAKGAKDAPILQQIPDATPFTAPPVRVFVHPSAASAFRIVHRHCSNSRVFVQIASAIQGAGVMESPMAAWGGPGAAASAAAAAPATGVGPSAGPAGVGDGAGAETSAPATAAAEGSVDVPPVGLPASVAGQQQAPQPVAAEEDDYDAD